MPEGALHYLDYFQIGNQVLKQPPFCGRHFQGVEEFAEFLDHQEADEEEKKEEHGDVFPGVKLYGDLTNRDPMALDGGLLNDIMMQSIL